MNSKALKARDRSSFPLFRAFSAIVFGEWHSPGPLAQAITFRALGADIRSFPTGSTASGSVPAARFERPFLANALPPI